MAKFKVIGDAGHGKGDPGAVGLSGSKEKDFNLNIVMRVNELFKNHPYIEFIPTRTTDVFIELADRAKIANKAKADLFWSCHANAGEEEANGTETWYTKAIDKAFAEVIHQHMIAVTGLRDRKVQTRSLSVLRNTTMPACLTEPGFLSNEKDERVLLDETFQKNFAEAVARGICTYLGVDFNARTTPKGTYPLDVELSGLLFEGLLIEGRSFIPAKLVLTALGLPWSYSLRKIYIGDNALETKIYDGTSYIKATDLKALDVVRNVMLDPDATNTKRVLIYPHITEEVTQ